MEAQDSFNKEIREILISTRTVAKTHFSTTRGSHSGAGGASDVRDMRALSDSQQERIANAVQKVASILLFKRLPEDSSLRPLAQFQCALLDKSSKEEILKMFHMLKKNDQDELISLIERSLPPTGAGSERGIDRLSGDPSILLRLRNEAGYNAIEALIDVRYQQKYIKDCVRCLSGLPIEKMKKSPHYNFLESLIYWRERSDSSSADPASAGVSLEENPVLIESLLDEAFLNDILPIGNFSLQDSPYSASNQIFFESLVKTFSYTFDISTLSSICRSFKNEKFRDLIIACSVKHLAETCSYKLVERIKEFRIEDQNLLWEVARVCAEKSPELVAAQIENFDIKDQEKLAELAHIIADRMPQILPMYIRNFGIKDQCVLISLAQKSARKNFRVTLSNLAKFGIETDDAKFKFAEEHIRIDPYTVSSCVFDLGISDQRLLCKIVKLCACEYPSNIILTLPKLKIEDPKERLEIAKICAQKEPKSFVANIKNFDIADQVGLVALATIVIDNDILTFINYVEKFEITDQDALISFARRSLNKYAALTATRISHFGIVSAGARWELFKMLSPCLNYHFAIELLPHFAHREFSSIDSLTTLNDLQTASSDVCPLDVLERIIAKYESLHPKHKLFQKALEDLEKKEASPNLIKQKLLLKIAAIQSEAVSDSGGMPLSEEIVTTIIKICDYRDSANRRLLLLSFLLAQDIPEYRAKYESLIEKESVVCDPLRRPMTLIAAWALNSKPLGADPATLAVEYEAVKTTLSAFNSTIKNANSGLEESLVRIITWLSFAPLSESQKLHFIFCAFREVTSAEELCQICKMGAVYLRLQGSSSSDERPLPVDFTKAQLKEKFLDLVQSKLFPLSNELIEKYLTLSCSQRVPQAIEIYASSIQDPIVKNEMVRFINAVLTDSFKGTRYLAAGNPHAEVLNASKKAGEPLTLWQQWQQLPSMLAEESYSATAAAGAGGSMEMEKDFNVKAWMTQKLLTDNHAEDMLPLIKSFLEAKVSSEGAEVRFASKNTIERICYSLFGCKTFKDKINGLKGLQRALAKDEKFKDSQWKKDVDDQLLLFASEEKKDFVTVLTDSWEDLFLCGTEVLGSCQRISGKPHINKCLLGYCMDGKVQMIAVKDPLTGKILARAILKLLVKEETKEPVIFLERVYSNSNSIEQIAAIYRMAQRCSEALDIPLYSINPDLLLGDAEEMLTSLGSPSPWEYEDGGAGVTCGKYTIKAKSVPIRRA